MKYKNLNRRHVLRGMLNGGVVAVALPVLDCFLNDSGTAFANGEKMPVRFGTWFWGLGGNNSILVPKKTGAGYEIPQQLAPIERVREHVNLITNLTAFRDGEPNLCHYSGWIIGRTGKAPKGSAERPGETIDVTIANEISRSNRFRTLTASATGDFRNTVSYENANSPNPPEISPLEFYTRLFGADFQDLNSPDLHAEPARDGAPERVVGGAGGSQGPAQDGRRARQRSSSTNTSLGCVTSRSSSISSSPSRSRSLPRHAPPDRHQRSAHGRRCGDGEDLATACSPI